MMKRDLLDLSGMIKKTRTQLVNLLLERVNLVLEVPNGGFELQNTTIDSCDCAFVCRIDEFDYLSKKL